MKEVSIESVLTVVNEFGDWHISNDNLDFNLSDNGMDSIKFIQIIVDIEEAFECEIPDSKLLITELNTVQKIFDTLHELYESQTL